MTIYYPPQVNGIQKTLDAKLDSGYTTSMTLNNITHIQNKPGVVILNRINAAGTEQAAADREFIIYTGASGSTLTGLTRNADNGSSDQDHAVGTIVEFVADVLWAQGLIDTFLGEHNTDGSHDMTSPQITTGINDSNDNEVLKITPTASAVNEVTLANAATGNNPVVSATGETNVGLDFKPKGTGVIRAKTTAVFQVVASDTNTATGDGKFFFRVPKELNGMNLVDCEIAVYTAGTTNTTDVQLRNKTDSADMLSTVLTIDSGETDSSTAAAAAVIDAAHDDVAEADIIAIDVDAVSTTEAQGLVVSLTFALP